MSAKKPAVKKTPASKAVSPKKIAVPQDAQAKRILKLVEKAHKATTEARVALAAHLTLATRQGGGGVDPSEVKHRVIDVIATAAIANNAPKPNLYKLVNGDDRLSLPDDLNLVDNIRIGLHNQYSSISESYPGGKAVGPIAAKNATTVANAIALTLNKAKGN